MKKIKTKFGRISTKRLQIDKNTFKNKYVYDCIKKICSNKNKIKLSS